MVDYGELFCDIIDTVVKARLQGISYDSTILCQIVDDSNKEQGKYIVSNGSAKFEAFSTDASLKKGNNVYVQIPRGDMNEQKFIIGKKNNNDNPQEFFNYKNPFDQLIDITSNLIKDDLSTGKGLVANDEDTPDISLWSYQPEVPLSGYTRLGIQAQFNTRLNPFFNKNNEPCEIVQGNYGLVLRVAAQKDDILNEEQNDQEQIEYYDFYLNTKHMNGNPYNFNDGYYQQEVVFDVSDLFIIKSMELRFYQEASTFIDKDGNARPSYITYDSNIEIKEEPNLFVKDPYICFGYDSEDIDEEKVYIFSSDLLNYNSEKDIKNLHLRWIHKLENNDFISVNSDNFKSESYTIFWYRYEHGHASADKYSGVYWRLLSIQDVEKGKSEYYNGSRQLNEGHKFYQQNESMSNENEDWLSLQDENYNPTFFNSILVPSSNVQTEQIKAVLIYGNQHFTSNILTFTNQNEALNSDAILEAIDALTIQCFTKTGDDEEKNLPINDYGNYLIYQQGNDLIDHSDAYKERYFELYFNLPSQKEDYSTLTEAEEIQWIVPNKNSMLIFDTENTNEYTIVDGDDIENDYIQPGYVSFSPKDITNIRLPYRIDSYYSQENNNNTIQVIIKKNGSKYSASKELTFGIQGTTGTDVTFVLDFTKGVSALTAGNTDAVSVKARLYDANNKEIDLTGHTIKWGLKTDSAYDETSSMLKIYIPPDEITIDKDEDTLLEIRFNSGSNPDINTYYRNFQILKAELTDWGDYPLVAYLPIPIRRSNDYQYLSGTTYIMYDSAGQIGNYFANPYVLHKTDGSDLSTTQQMSIEVYDESGLVTSANKFAPQVIRKNRIKEIEQYFLQPLNFYVENEMQQICIVIKENYQVVWIQPILIYQNRYPSKMLNQWNGDLVVDNENNAILAAKIAAGKKDTNNTFTGVILGDFGKEEIDESSNEISITKNTGIYGFQQGVQSFGFTDDGKAFIGKSGVGQIRFDGNKGIIDSLTTDASNIQRGMKIDLTGYDNLDGGRPIPSITAYDFELYADGYNTANDGKYLKITTKTYDDVNGEALQIGSSTNKFTVRWDGTIEANSGTIGGWKIDGTKLIGTTITQLPNWFPAELASTVYLDSSTGYISALNLYTKEANINSLNISNTIKLYEGQAVIGQFGNIASYNNQLAGLGFIHSSGNLLHVTGSGAFLKANLCEIGCVLDSEVSMTYSGKHELKVNSTGIYAYDFVNGKVVNLLNLGTPVAVFG